MYAFFYGVIIRWKLDLRSKGVLLTYYIVPLLFFAFMGGIFSSVNPASKETLVQSMTVFGVTMGAMLGTPIPLVSLYGSEIKKAYQVGGIPLWVPVLENYLSACIHLLVLGCVIFLVAPFMFDAPIPSNIFLYFIGLAAFILASAAVGTVLGLFIKSTSKLTMISQVIFLPSIMLSGIMFPVDLLPGVFASIGKFFPATMGFSVMRAEHLTSNLLMPLFVVMFVAFIICAVRLRLMKN